MTPRVKPWRVLVLLVVFALLSLGEGVEVISSSISVHTLNLPPAWDARHVEHLLDRFPSTNTHGSKHTVVGLGDTYTAVVFALTFDHPVFVSRRGDNASDSQISVSTMHEDDRHCLNGAVQLSCGSQIFFSTKSRGTYKGLPSYVVPLHGCNGTNSLCWLFNAAYAGVSPTSSAEEVLPATNEARFMLLMEFMEDGALHEVNRVHVLQSGAGGTHSSLSHMCSVQLTTRTAPKEDKCAVVGFTGFDGQAVTGSYSFTNEDSSTEEDDSIEMPDAHSSFTLRPEPHQTHYNFKYVNAGVCGGDKTTSKEAAGEELPFRQKHFERMQQSGHVCAAHAASPPENTAMLEEAQRARAQLADRAHYFQFLQILAYARSAEDVSATQVLDLIADPIIALVVPVAVAAAVSAMKDPIIDAASPTIQEAAGEAMVPGVAGGVALPAFIEEAIFMTRTSATTGRGELKRMTAAERATHKQKLKAERAAALHEHSMQLRRAYLGDAPSFHSKMEGTALAKVPEEVSAAACSEIFQAIALATGDNLRHAVNRSVVIQASRVLITSLTTSLTTTVTHIVSQRSQKTLMHIPTHKLTRPMIPFLTHSLGVSISQAMTRKPEYDYFCHYCLNSSPKLYCQYCGDDIANTMALNHYVQYFGGYYSRYYDAFYAEMFADWISQATMEDNPPVGSGQNAPVASEMNAWKGMAEGSSPSGDRDTGGFRFLRPFRRDW